MPLTKNELNEALEEQSKTIINTIETEITGVRNDLFDRIDRLEKFYALDERVKKIEKKLGIELSA